MNDTETRPKSDGPIEIQIDIACPDCEYNLRGLPGPIVNCPECGLTTDVPVLATRQWNKPWYKAPGFNTLMWPAVIAFISWIAFGVLFSLFSGQPLVVYSLILFAFALWVWFMIRAA